MPSNPYRKFIAFTYRLRQMLGCDKDDGSLATVHGGMVSAKYFFISVCY